MPVGQVLRLEGGLPTPLPSELRPGSSEPKMKTLVALDSDGTCDVGNPPGPVPVAWILLLKARRDEFRFVRVGNVQLEEFGIRGPVSMTGEPMAGLTVPGGKSGLLRRWKTDSADSGFERYIVVDDNPAQYFHGWKGWEFMFPSDFIKEFHRPEIVIR